jgi:beta-glucosidase
MLSLATSQEYANALPKDFLHGYSSASYQIEGGHNKGGRGPSVWDEALKDAPNGNGDEACSSFEHWREDVELLKQYGATSYRFSISWSRLIPLGECMHCRSNARRKG